MKSIRDILTGRKPVTLGPKATVLEAARAMKDDEVGAVLVRDPAGEMLGCFTERDLMTRVVVPERDPAAVSLEDVMTTELFTATPDQRINEVARAMQERHIRHLPVVEDGRVIAMLSARDLTREHLDLKRIEVEVLTAYIEGKHSS